MRHHAMTSDVPEEWAMIEYPFDPLEPGWYVWERRT
jgi:hypothetical protein